jgi:hypothetical protein
MALLTAGIMPARTARRTEHVGLLPAFAAHLAALALAFVPAVLLPAFAEEWPAPDLRWIRKELAGAWGDIGRNIEHAPIDALASVLIGLAVIVIGFLLLATALTAWGASDERLRSSFRHAVRRTWLHTPHLLLASLSSCVLLIALVEVLPGWCTRHPPQRPPMPATPQTADAPEWQAYEKAMAAWKPKRDHYEQMVSAVPDDEPSGQTWHDTVGVICLVSGVWWLWGLFRAVGAPRAAPGPTRAPLCERCGYNLTGASLDGRCPECGACVRDSLGPDVRPGVVWEHRGDIGWRRAWWRCAVDAVRRPMQFGRQLRVYGGTTDHRRFLIVAMLLAFGVATVAILEWWLFLPQFDDRSPSTHDLCVTILLAGGSAALAVLFLTSAAAGLVAFALHVSTGRNLLAGAVRAACYLSGGLLAWGVLASCVPLPAMLAATAICHLLRCDSPEPILSLLGCAWCAMNVLCFVVYLICLRKTTGAMSYANK